LHQFSVNAKTGKKEPICRKLFFHQTIAYNYGEVINNLLIKFL